MLNPEELSCHSEVDTLHEMEEVEKRAGAAYSHCRAAVPGAAYIWCVAGMHYSNWAVLGNCLDTQSRATHGSKCWSLCRKHDSVLRHVTMSLKIKAKHPSHRDLFLVSLLITVDTFASTQEQR